MKLWKQQRRKQNTLPDVANEQNTSPTEHASYRQHLKDVFHITYPIILSEIFQNTLPVMDIAFVGRLSKRDLGAAALATVWFNLWNASMMGFMVRCGMDPSVDSLARSESTHKPLPE